MTGNTEVDPETTFYTSLPQLNFRVADKPGVIESNGQDSIAKPALPITPDSLGSGGSTTLQFSGLVLALQGDYCSFQFTNTE
jgi:hypothetical protein